MKTSIHYFNGFILKYKMTKFRIVPEATSF